MADYETRRLSAIKKRKEARELNLQKARKRQRLFLAGFIILGLLIGILGYAFLTKKSFSTHIPTKIYNRNAKPTRQESVSSEQKNKKPARDKMRTFEDFDYTNEELTPEDVKDVKALVIAELKGELETLNEKISSPSIDALPDIRLELEQKRDAILKKIETYENIDPKDEKTWNQLD